MKQYLQLLLERDFREISMPKYVNFLINNYDEDQLIGLLYNGANISKDIVLYYYEHVGFRCMNINYNLIGHKPVCRLIEKTLNNKLLIS
jgi:hypothetical protein